MIELNFEHIKQMLQRIETQTTKIEVRVTELEADSNAQKGAMKAITTIYVVTIAVLTMYLSYKSI